MGRSFKVWKVSTNYKLVEDRVRLRGITSDVLEENDAGRSFEDIALGIGARVEGVTLGMFVKNLIENKESNA